MPSESRSPRRIRKAPCDESSAILGQLKMAECEHTADRRPAKSFEFELHLIEKASQIYVSVIFSSFSLNVMLFIRTKSTMLHKF